MARFELETWKHVLDLERAPTWDVLQERLATALGLSTDSGWEVILVRVIDVAKLKSGSLELALDALLQMIGRETYRGQSLDQAINTARRREINAFALKDPESSWDRIRAAHLATVGLSESTGWTWHSVLAMHESRLKLPKLRRSTRGDNSDRWDRWDRVFDALITAQTG